MKSLTMKKVTLLGVGAALCLATAASFGAMSISKASAASLSSTGDNSGTVTISYQQADEWTVTIPQSMTIGTAATVSASNVAIENGKTLTVTVSGDDYVQDGNKWQLKYSGKTIDYTLKAAATEGELSSASPLENEGTVLTVESSETEGSASIIGEVSGKPSTGGNSYTDTLTFQVDVE